MLSIPLKEVFKWSVLNHLTAHFRPKKLFKWIIWALWTVWGAQLLYWNIHNLSNFWQYTQDCFFLWYKVHAFPYEIMSLWYCIWYSGSLYNGDFLKGQNGVLVLTRDSGRLPQRVAGIVIHSDNHLNYDSYVTPQGCFFPTHDFCAVRVAGSHLSQLLSSPGE